jgi:hypothetical protein
MIADDHMKAQSAMFSQWKVLTGALLEQQSSAKGHQSNATTDYADIIESVDSVVGPYVQAGVDSKRHRNLEMILGRTAKLALVLFSQPGRFHFDFAGSRQGSIVVFPGLVQVAGDEGQVLTSPRTLSRKEVVTGQ